MSDISWEGGINSSGAAIVYTGISKFLTRSVGKDSITNAKPAWQMRDQGLLCTRLTFLIPLSSLRLSDTRGIAPLCLFRYVEQQLGTSRLWRWGKADNTVRWKAPACTANAESPTYLKANKHHVLAIKPTQVLWGAQEKPKTIQSGAAIANRRDRGRV